MSNRAQTVSDLKATLGNGAQVAKFAVTIPIPIVLTGVSAVNNLLSQIPVINKIISYTGNAGMKQIPAEHINVLAKSTTFPGKRVTTIDVWDRGHKYVVRDVADFDHRWNVTFYNTPGLDLRLVFETWMYELDRYDSSVLRTPFLTNNMGLGTPKFLADLNPGYMVDMVVSQLDCQGNESAKFELIHAFPVELSEIVADASQVNQLSEFTVTFAYSTWDRIQGEDVSLAPKGINALFPTVLV